MADRVVVSLDKLVPELALMHVMGGELPSLVGIGDAGEQALQLLFLGNVKEELDRHGAAAGEVQLEIVDVLVALLPDVAGDEFRRQVLFAEKLGMYPHDHGLFIIGPVENADDAARGKRERGSP